MFSIAMDIDPSGTGKSDHTFIWSDDFAINSKSYRCTFCKRGFSNAQALGGHMNIHRKDRAKLREFSGENLLSLDITKYSTDYEENSVVDNSEKSSFESEMTNKVLDDKASHEVLEVAKENSTTHPSLPLFADHREEAKFDKHVEIHGELDLELRLGSEPHNSKSKQ